MFGRFVCAAFASPCEAAAGPPPIKASVRASDASPIRCLPVTDPPSRSSQYDANPDRPLGAFPFGLRKCSVADAGPPRRACNPEAPSGCRPPIPAESASSGRRLLLERREVDVDRDDGVGLDVATIHGRLAAGGVDRQHQLSGAPLCRLPAVELTGGDALAAR